MASTKLPARLLDNSAVPELAVTGDLTVDTNTLYVDSGNNNVGIGTTSPGEKFAVKGDASYIEITHPTASSFSGMKFSEGGVPQGSLQNIGSTFSTVARRGNFEIFHNTGGNVTLQHPGGNVGIGTSAPTELLQVFGSTSSAIDIGTDNSAEVVAEFIPDSTNARNGRLRIAGTNSPENNSIALISDSSTNVGMAFVTTSSNVKNENMMIHSTGVIQMPKQASFLAIYPAATAGGSNSIIIFGGEQHDEGGNYNQSNGRFTAPVAGKYFFTVSILLDPENTGTAYYARLAFGVNGTTSAVYGDSLNTAFACDAGTSTTVSSYQSVSMSTNLNLAAGDYVTVHNAGTSPTYGTGYGSFGGFLIG